MFLGKLAQDVGIPEGVFNIITGDRETGAALVASPSISMVLSELFTHGHQDYGSFCSKPQVALELGGKSAMVIFADTEIERAVEATIKGCLTNGGKFVLHIPGLVQEDIKDDLLKKLKTRWKRYLLGTPLPKGARRQSMGNRDDRCDTTSSFCFPARKNRWFPQ